MIDQPVTIIIQSHPWAWLKVLMTEIMAEK